MVIFHNLSFKYWRCVLGNGRYKCRRDDRSVKSNPSVPRVVTEDECILVPSLPNRQAGFTCEALFVSA